MAQEKTILESIREYLTTCPVFSGRVIHKDYLPDGEGYSVNTAKGEPVYKKYADGKVLKQYWFTVTMKALDTEDASRTVDGIGNCQYLEEWLEKQSLDGSLPEMEGVTPVRIDTVKSGYLDSREAGYVKYLMECRMVYLDIR